MKRFSLCLAIVASLCWIVTFALANAWNLQVVDDAGNRGYQSRIAVTSDGTPYILYCDSGHGLYLAWWVSGGGDSGGWDWMLVPTAYAYSVYQLGLEVDSNDNLHIVSSSSSYNGSWYGIFDHDTKSWILSPEKFTTIYGQLDLVLIENGGTVTPKVAILRSSDIQVATRSDLGTWSFETAYDDPVLITGSISLAADSSDMLHICFHEGSSNSTNLKYLTNATVDTLWISQYVVAGNTVGNYSAIAVDDDNVPYIVYYDADNDDLKYAKLVSP